MKRNFAVSLKTAALVFLCVFLFLSCGSDQETDAAYVLDRDTSYAMGMFIANYFTSQYGFPHMQYDYDAFRDGFRAFNEATETRISWEVAMDHINNLFMRIEAQEYEDFWVEAEWNLIEGMIFLEENAARPEVITTPSGLQYEIIIQGEGERPGPYDTVLVHYEGIFLTGQLFDSSYMRGEPTAINLGIVIEGWREGLQLMNVGSVFNLYIPPDLAYGMGSPGEFPGNMTLVFIVELLEIVSND